MGIPAHPGRGDGHVLAGANAVQQRQVRRATRRSGRCCRARARLASRVGRSRALFFAGKRPALDGGRSVGCSARRRTATPWRSPAVRCRPAGTRAADRFWRATVATDTRDTAAADARRRYTNPNPRPCPCADGYCRGDDPEVVPWTEGSLLALGAHVGTAFGEFYSRVLHG